ncbi:uncharacterized protein LOC143541285 [Bidens hawaiensis]|uniref:uncharacterized protein LOC143541285 n=1 Tax=Bidens hawaiensis TaxID=980011 RepID=UPI00404B78E6
MGFTLKLTVLSATVVICKLLLSPLITDFAISELPTIWTSITSRLKPPYLYVVINFIIITIAATSRLPSTDQPVKVVLPVELPPTQEPQVLFHGGYVNDLKLVQALEPRFSAPQFSEGLIHQDMKVDEDGYKELEENIVNKSVISVSAWKPPVSAGFSRRRKRAKAMLEGVKTLGVSTKPKRQDTLESTWKAITEGRSTRHLRKSDTWNTHTTPNSEDLLIINNSNNNSSNNYNDNNNHFKRMTKSATFAEGRTKPSPPQPQPLEPQLSGCGESGRLSKEPSLEQEELNRRVEAFINKVNENMRLQRQQSLDQYYMDMIKRGAY